MKYKALVVFFFFWQHTRSAGEHSTATAVKY